MDKTLTSAYQCLTIANVKPLLPLYTEIVIQSAWVVGGEMIVLLEDGRKFHFENYADMLPKAENMQAKKPAPNMAPAPTAKKGGTRSKKGKP